MTRVTVTLTDEHLEIIDRLMGDSGQYVPDRRGRREAIPSLLVAYDRNLHETVRLERQPRDLADRIGAIERARDEAVAQTAVTQSRLEAARKALADERCQHAETRRVLSNAMAASDRLRGARDRYRDLVRAIDAALRGRNGDEGGGPLVHRVWMRLRERGIGLPHAASTSPRSPDRRAKAPRS